MTTSHLYYEGQYSTQGLTLGRVVNVSPHCGQDHALQIVVEFERGRMRLGDEQAELIVREICAALRIPRSARRPNVRYPMGNCSGALADLGADE